MKRYLVALCLALMLSACGAQKKIFNLEKEGKIYNYSEMVSFYYPRDWIVETDSVKLSLDIFSNSSEEALFFDSFEMQGSNSPSEMLDLYVKSLEELGVVVERKDEISHPEKFTCFLLDGYNAKDERKFREIVVFFDGTQYIYSYVASPKDYEKNIDVMQLYLESLVVNEVAKAI